MKTQEKEDINPIKAKYNQKLGFFKKNKIKFSIFIDSIKDNKSIMDDINSLLSMVVSIISYGILGIFALSLFSFPITFLGILGCGSLLWLIENKFINFITRIISSIKIIDIN